MASHALVFLSFVLQGVGMGCLRPLATSRVHWTLWAGWVVYLTEGQALLWTEFTEHRLPSLGADPIN